MLEKQLNVDSDPLLFGRSLMKRSVRSVNSHMVHYLVFCCKNTGQHESGKSKNCNVKF